MKEVEFVTNVASDCDGTDRCGDIDVFDVEEKLSLVTRVLEDRMIHVMEDVLRLSRIHVSMPRGVCWLRGKGFC